MGDYSSKFEFKKVILTNSDGEKIDIKNLIADLEISESINMVFMVYTFTIIDAVSLLEKYGIVGGEKIDLQIEWDNSIIKKKLIVVSYNSYTRNANNNAQGYKVQCVSEEAMKARVLVVDKELVGTIGTMITDLYSEIKSSTNLIPYDLSTEGDHRFIVPNMQYEDLFKFLISRAQNTEGVPFYFYETLWMGQILSSWSKMISFNPVIELLLNNDYDDKDLFGSTEIKMRDLRSSLNMSHYRKFTSGSFVSKVHTIDIATKSYRHNRFSITEESLPKMEIDRPITDSFDIAGTTLSDIEEPYKIVVNANSKPWDDNKENCHSKLEGTSALRKMVYGNQDFITHTFSVNGNQSFWSGFAIGLKLPISTDPSAISTLRDDMMSGKYVIASITHKFNKKGNYHCEMTVKKDSVDRQKMMKKYRNM